MAVFLVISPDIAAAEFGEATSEIPLGRRLLGGFNTTGRGGYN
ncbi:hypothetical protein CDL12_24455 [Handroanthus impetiginosus]|uniref:Uncharacterized protein n=1 Tax=Handroanthus impetiginosus TaxID=429701 RepID=A0A2G9GCL7_9LAMI|nr:hypothetical protein CDL12_24455 [Handroanthus impetiginosus]